MHDILLLHGALGSSDDLKPLGECLLKLNFRVHYLTFSGHQSVPFRAEFGIHQFAGEVEEFILAQNIKGCTVFGYSLGGYVALYLASSKNNLIGRIITLGTKFDWTPEIIKHECSLLEPQRLAQSHPTFFQSLQKVHVELELLLKVSRDLIYDFSNHTFLDESSLARISIPALLGVAEKDKMVSAEETENVQKAIPGATRFVLPGAKHAITTADPMALSQIIGDLGKNTRSPLGGIENGG